MHNGVWAVAQQLTTVLTAGLTGIIVARSFTVAEFGVYNYALTMLSLGTALTVAGLQGLAVRLYSELPGSVASVTKALTLIREIASVLCYITLTALAYFTGDSEVLLATAVSCVGLFGKILDTPELHLQAILRNDAVALTRISTAVVYFTARLLLVMNGQSLLWVIAMTPLEYISNGIFLRAVGRRFGDNRNSSVESPIRARDALRLAAPLIASAFINQANLKFAIIALQLLSGSMAVGQYSAAVRIVDILVSLPTAYMAATLPALLQVRKSGAGKASQYERLLQQSFDGAATIGIAIALAVWLFAEQMLTGLFGAQYGDAVGPLRLLSLSLPFVFMGAVFSKWLVAENRLWTSFGRHLLGLVANIALCVFLIPRFGPTGAAFAVSFSYISSSYLFCFALRDTRSVALMMSRGLIAPVRFAWRVRK